MLTTLFGRNVPFVIFNYKTNVMIYSAYKIEWTEYERGWGQRSDGTSYYASKELAEKCAKDYDEKYNSEDSAPDEYTKPGKPVLVEVSKEVYNNVQKEAKENRGYWGK